MHISSDSKDTSGGEPAIGRRLRLGIDALAGAMAGCVSRIVIGPLDVIKIRFQVQLEPIRKIADSVSKPKYTGFRQAFVTIVKEEGIQGLWRGTVPGLLLTIPYTAVQFVALHQCKEAAGRMGLTAPDHEFSSLVSFASGAIAGSAATAASYPFDLLRTTMAAQGEPRVYRNVFQAAQGIVQEGGFQGLYRGLGVTLIEIIPYAALQFGLYDTFKSSLKSLKDKKRRDLDLSPASENSRFENFTCGLMSGLVAKLASHPLDVAKKRYQVAGLRRSLSYGARVEGGFALKSLQDGLIGILRNEGVAGLWKGSIPSIIKAAPAAAVTFTAYEIILTMMLEQAALHVQK